MAAKLVIEFEKVLLAGPPELYYLHTTVEADSTPDNIRQCLVVEELGATEPEKILRVATFAEIPLLNAISIISQGVSDPSLITPAVGDKYIVATGGVAPWNGQDNNVATWTGTTWTYIEAAAGMAAWVVDEQLRYAFNGISSTWVATPGTGLPELPVDVNYFSDISLPVLTVWPGWILQITTPFPPIWEFAMGLGVGSTLYYEVTTIMDPGTNREFLVVPTGATTIFPTTPERGLTVDYYDPTIPLVSQHSSVTAVANRDFTGLLGTAYRISEHYDTFTDETVANNKVNSLRAQAHTLVQDTNEDTFTGTSMETFE